MNAKRNSGILAYRESLGNAGIPGHSCTFRNCKYFMDGPLTMYRAKINAKRNSEILAYRESLGNAGIPGHACIFRNYKYLIFLPSPSPTPSP